MHYHYSCPSKVFLFGEYAILKNAPAAVLAINPRFYCQDDLAEVTIHPQSPAGKCLRARNQASALPLMDPHQGRGGFGASSAMWLFAQAALDHLDKNIQELMQIYHQHTDEDHGIRASGADWLTQYYGDCCIISPKPLTVNNIPWPFQDLAFCIIATGHKCATHEHLNQTLTIDINALAPLCYMGIEALKAADPVLLIHVIKQYQQTLIQMNCCTEHTQTLLNKLYQHSAVLAAKGCGAMGADTIIMLTPVARLAEIQHYCDELQLKIIARGTELAPGLQTENTHEY